MGLPERIRKAEQSPYWAKAQEIANSLQVNAPWPESAWMLQVQIVELAETALATPSTSTSDNARRAAEEVLGALWMVHALINSPTRAREEEIAAIISKHFAALPVGQAPEALKRSSKVCRSVIPGARVELIFQNLQDAQAVHKWLVTLAAAPAGNDAGSSRETLCACRTFNLNPHIRAFLDGCDFVHTVVACPSKKVVECP